MAEWGDDGCEYCDGDFGKLRRDGSVWVSEVGTDIGERDYEIESGDIEWWVDECGECAGFISGGAAE